MTLAFYFDHNLDRAIVDGLRLRGINVLTAWEDGAAGRADVSLLERATMLGMVFVSNDRDLSVIASRWRREGRLFPGPVRCRQSRIFVGIMVDDLEIVARAMSAEEMKNQTIYLPFPRDVR